MFDLEISAYNSLFPFLGESIDIVSRGCIFVPLERRDFDRDVQAMMIRASMPRSSMGISVPLTVESAKDERSLLLRLASIVRMKDPDMLVSLQKPFVILDVRSLISRLCLV